MGGLVIFHQRQDKARTQKAGIEPNTLNPDPVFVLFQSRIVRHADRRQDEPVLLSDIAADLVDAAFEPVIAKQDEVHQVWRNFEVDFVSVDGVAKFQRLWRDLFRYQFRFCFFCSIPAAHKDRRCREAGRCKHERDKRQAGEQREEEQDAGNNHQSGYVTSKLCHEREIDCAFFAPLGKKQRGGNRHDDGRNL